METQQEYRLLGSFSAFPLAHQLCPGIRGLNTLNHKGTGHPRHKVIYPCSREVGAIPGDIPGK